MKDEAFLAAQRAGIYAPHVAPINRLVDSLVEDEWPKGRGWLPHVAPLHGGVNARVLSILRDPGAKTLLDGGSGMLCVENDDATAAKQCELFGDAGIAVSDVTPWNAYPWYINKPPSGPQVTEGLVPLRHVIALMESNLQVVLLQGGHARSLWRKLMRLDKGFVGLPGVTVVETFHPGNQALQTNDPDERRRRVDRRIQAMAEVAAVLS